MLSCFFNQLDDQVTIILPLIPIPLREAVTRLLHKEPEQRPTAHVLTMIKFFRDPIVHALQFLDVSKMKDVCQKEHFYTTTLRDTLPYLPKVRIYTKEFQAEMKSYRWNKFWYKSHNCDISRDIFLIITSEPRDAKYCGESRLSILKEDRALVNSKLYLYSVAAISIRPTCTRATPFSRETSAYHAQVSRLRRKSGINTSGRIFTRSYRRRKCCPPCCSLCCTSSKTAPRRSTIRSCSPRSSMYYMERKWMREPRAKYLISPYRHSPPLSLSLPYRPLFANRKSIQGTVTLLENLHVILEKTPPEYECEVLSMLYAAFENSTVQVRVSKSRSSSFFQRNYFFNLYAE